MEFLVGMAIGFSLLAIVELYVIIHCIKKHDALLTRFNQLQTRVSDAEWRDESVRWEVNERIRHLQELLQSQVQKALAPEAEELAAWIKETEEELEKDES